jgi:hypothetical protein
MKRGQNEESGAGTKKRTAQGMLTPRTIAGMERGEWRSDPAARGAGVMQARKLANGSVAFYFRFTAPNGDRIRLPIGIGIELPEARVKARELSSRYQGEDRDLRAAMEAEQREAERQRHAEQAAAEAATLQQRATLGALLTAYVAQLRRDGRHSAREVERSIKRHVEKAWPKLWNTPAEAVTADDLLSVVAKIADDSKLRQAAKLRAYLRAAYAAAIRARQDARALPALRSLRLTANPARDLVTIEGASNARERALSLAELRAYWRRIVALSDPSGALLRFHLLTGAQRVEQLGRITTDDYDADTKTVRLRDGKGRRKVARRHDVPMTPAAADAMRSMQGGVLGPFLFTVTAGESGAVYATVQHRVREVCAAMADAGELEKGAFTVGDLRRTVESRLSGAGIGKDVRAQLQSHGLGGVQGRHYDRHDYLGEKRAALETLHRLLTGSGSTVTPMRRRKAG